MAPSVETVIIFPALMAIICLIVVLGRLVLTQQQLTAIASSAAQGVTLKAQGTSATVRRVVERGLQDGGVACLKKEINADLSGLAIPAGQISVVQVTIRCTVSLHDIAIPLLSGTVELSAEATSAVDRFRTR